MKKEKEDKKAHMSERDRVLLLGAGRMRTGVHEAVDACVDHKRVLRAGDAQCETKKRTNH